MQRTSSPERIRTACRALAGTAALLLACASQAALPHELRPHTARYQIDFKSLAAGDLELTLRGTGVPGQYQYETRPFPSFLAGFVVKAASRERSTFQLTPTGVRPLRYELDDSTQASDKDARLTYDWNRGRVQGSVQGASIDLPLSPGFQDVMSIRMAVPADLLAGRKPGSYLMLDGREPKTYVFENRGPQKLRTALGELDTVVYVSHRTGTRRSRTWTYWYAPGYDYLPVRIEQRDPDGSLRLLFRVRSLTWNAPPPAS